MPGRADRTASRCSQMLSTSLLVSLNRLGWDSLVVGFGSSHVNQLLFEL